MRWTRILKYTAVLYVTTFVVGLVFGFLRGFVEATSGAPLPENLVMAINLGLALSMFATVSAVFCLMAYRTRRRALAGTHLVALAVWLTSLPLNVALLGQAMGVWLLQGAFMEACVLFGLGAGVGLRTLVGLLHKPKDGPTAPEKAAPEPAGPRG